MRLSRVTLNLWRMTMGNSKIIVKKFIIIVIIIIAIIYITCPLKFRFLLNCGMMMW